MPKIKLYTTVTVPLSDLIANAYNPKLGDRDKLTRQEMEKLKRSIVQHGYMAQIIVRENEEGNYEIVDGYHRYLVLKELDPEATIPVTNLGKCTLEEAMTRTLSLEMIKVPIDQVLKAELYQTLTESITPAELAELIPDTETQITDAMEQLKGAEPEAPQPDGDGNDKAEFKIATTEDMLKQLEKSWKKLAKRNRDLEADELMLKIIEEAE